MDPGTILKIIYKAVITIKETVKLVKANQQQCKRLSQRIDAITSAIKVLTDKDLQRNELQNLLNNYRYCVEDCCEFVTQFKDEKSWYLKVYHHQTYKDKFEDFNLQLTQCATDLNLGINLKQLFDRNLDTDTASVEPKRITPPHTAANEQSATSEHSQNSAQQNDNRLMCGGRRCEKCHGCRDWKNPPSNTCRFVSRGGVRGFFGGDPLHGYNNNIPKCSCSHNKK
ncbi:unnamed protein product [Adineta steineri]|uniref:Mixed lineage kinase domain-containing protein n=1 Tax=Adineta steineri TaxID=433720 RepID=A0A814PQU2_9BILA|nr:unnamed protein product [Adineta steineri]CAF3834854.1 unnamed protein product [Adineta steineri]